MCVEVRLGAKIADTCGDLAALIRSNVILTDRMQAHLNIVHPWPSACLCHVDFDKTLDLAGYEVDPDETQDFEIAIRKKKDPKDNKS
jgi:hypothetical protein